MNQAAYKITLLLFVVAVAIGVCVVLSEFNHALGPASGISALGLEESGRGVYRIEFLGEKVWVDFPQIREKVTPLYNSLRDYATQFKLFIENLNLP